LRAAIEGAAPDILCVQEARQDQVAFLERILPGHQRLGVGRDDGQSGGEHCAIYFNLDRFAELGSGTFWLTEPTDAPGGSGLNVKRICTWTRLRDLQTGRTVLVFNAHQYLTEKARQSAAQLLRDQLAVADPADTIILTADFNAGPTAPSRRLLTEDLLSDSTVLAGQNAGIKTFHHAGIPLWPLDGILLGPGWRVNNYQLVKGKYRHKYPSDHFGVLADLAYRDQ
jgi:endonuclease/exonuclease/phosphatase family metal-dependent hydrolase